MFLMKRKTLALFAGGVGALGLLAMAEKYRQSRAEMKKAALIQDIRQELSPKTGRIRCSTSISAAPP